MAISSTGKLTFKCRLTPNIGVNNNIPVTVTVTVPEATNCDVAARAAAVTQSSLGVNNIDFVEIWLIASDSV